MYQLEAGAFYKAISALGTMHGAVQSLMKAGVFENADDDLMTDSDVRGRVAGMLIDLQQALNVLGTPITKKAVDRLTDKITNKSNDVKYKDFMNSFTEINNRLRDELEATSVWVIDQSRSELMQQSTPLFGEEVASNFISAKFEIAEAGKCLALARPTASVFHLMRTMEIALRAMARCLSIPDPTKPSQRNWGAVLGAIKKGIDSKWPTVADRPTGDGRLFEELYALLEAVRNPWRNSTMHVEIKYTDDEADHIFRVVRSFMKRLASRMDENGMPLA